MKYQMKLTESQRVLVEENIGLVSFAMSKLPIYYFDSREDAYQIGCIGLMKAAISFDPERKIQFSTYAMRCVVNELRMALRHINSSNPPGRTCSFDAPVGNGDEDDFTLGELIPSSEAGPEERCITVETLRAVLVTVKRMRDRDAWTILRMTVQNRRQEEIAAALGITQSAVSRKLRRIRAALIEAIS